MTIRGRRALSIVGMLLVADGATFAADPAGQIRLWTGKRGPRWYRRVMGFFSNHLSLCRAIAATEFLAGTALLIGAARER